MQVREREVRQYTTPDGRSPFQQWFVSLRDKKTQAIVDKRIERLRRGNLGDHRRLTGGLVELRIHYGAGYRLYCGERGNTVVLLLCGGTKRAQQRDIQQARDYWEDAKRRP